jgi:hypothetical protein
MGITAASMLSKFKASRPAPPTSQSDAAATQAYSDALLAALFQAICDDIRQNMVVTCAGTTPAQGAPISLTSNAPGSIS